MDAKAFVTIGYLNQGIVPITIIEDKFLSSIEEFLPDDYEAARKSKRKFRKLKRKAKKAYPSKRKETFEGNQALVEKYMHSHIFREEFPYSRFVFWRLFPWITHVSHKKA